MAISPEEELCTELESMRGGDVGSFPKVIFDSECDTLEVLLENKNYVARRIECILTVYLDVDNREQAVGFLIQGLHKH